MSSDSVDSLDLPGPTYGLLSTRDTMEARMEHQTNNRFKLLYRITSILGSSLVSLMLTWTLTWRGGLAWDDIKLRFNWHPFLMFFSMIFTYSQSILVYRWGRYKPKKGLKLSHAALHGTAFIAAVIGLQAAFDSHNYADPPKPNLYTLHSWIGLITIILFAYQLLTGFLAFLYPTFSQSIRSALLPVHVSVGTATFALALMAAVTGFLEKGIGLTWPVYAQRVPEAYMINFLGVLTAFYGVLVLYMVTEPDYKRKSLPEDEVTILTGHHE